MKDITYLATAINEILNDNELGVSFMVYLNTNVIPNYADSYIAVTMAARRDFMGMPSEELDVETLTVSLTFNLPADINGEDLYKRDNALDIIHAHLLGEKSFFINTPDDVVYKATSLLAQEQPSDPFIDAGRTTQLIVLTGTIYVANASCKAMVGNEVDVYIGRGDGTSTTANMKYEKLLHTNRALSYQTTSETFLALDNTYARASVINTSAAATKSLSFIYTGKEIEDEFLQIAEGVLRGLDKRVYGIEQIYTYKCVYPTFTIICPFTIASVTFQDANGVLMQYTLNVHVGTSKVQYNE